MAAMGIGVQGALLFLFIPLVLFLLLGQPFGPAWSVLLGLAIMIGHRVVAAPWMAKWADVRCLWCGRVGPGLVLPVAAGGRVWPMNACSAAHANRASRVLDVVDRYRLAIGLGIFPALGWLVVASLVAAAGHPLLAHDTNALLFRILVAATVVTASLVPVIQRPVASRSQAAGAPTLPPPAGPAGGPSPDGPLRCPFPLHNFFLLGLGRTLWVFRLVGAWWLIDAAVRLVR